MPGPISRLPDDAAAVSREAEDTHNWKIWRKVHSVSVGLDSRKYSAIWLYHRTANVTSVVSLAPASRAGRRSGAGQRARRRGEAGWMHDICPSQTD
jgi:hypothetical protein